jgi:hypothetical protein
MKTIAIKMKRYAGRVNIVNNNDLGKKVLHTLLISLGALALFYVFLLGNLVINVVERRSLETELRALGSEVADLELTYLSMSNEIDATLGRSMGFSEKEAKFTSRNSSLGSVKLTKNEI